MRSKSENEARDRYARLYASALAVESIIGFLATTSYFSLTIEAEDEADWDDIVQVFQPSGVVHRHQVKRQQTALSSKDFEKYVKSAASGDAETHYHFAFPTLIEVEGVGNVRILRGLCARNRQEGADQQRVINGLREGERAWLDAIIGWTGLDEAGALSFLLRVHLDVIHYEEDLEIRAIRLLEPVYRAATQDAWATVKAFVADKDGVVEIVPSVILEKLPPPAADEVEMFYWSFIEEVEAKFEVNHWAWLTDNLARNLLPESFHDGVYEFSLSVQRAVWPERHPELAQALQNLTRHAVEYIAHFCTRCELHGNWMRENTSFKGQYDKPWYQAACEASEKWDQENVPRLINMIVALNELFDAVRKCLRPTYRLRDGKLGLHDDFGARNDGNAGIHYFSEYASLD